MTEKAAIGGKMVIALGLMCMVLIIGLGATFVSYTSIINAKDQAYKDYTSTHSVTDSQYDDYVSTHSVTDSQYDDYVTTHHHTDQEFDSAVTAPRLVTVGVETEDEWYILPYEPPSTFRIHGYVTNVGVYTAYNPKIHIVAYKLEEVKVVDDYVTLDVLSSGSWTTFDSTYVYNGGPIAQWTITPEWTASP